MVHYYYCYSTPKASIPYLYCFHDSMIGYYCCFYDSTAGSAIDNSIVDCYNCSMEYRYYSMLIGYRYYSTFADY